MMTTSVSGSLPTPLSPRRSLRAGRALLRLASLGLLLFLGGGLLLMPLLAQTTTGSITGRIQNVVTGQYLNNVRVSVRGTDLLAFTDQSGTYRLVNVPSGPVVLDVLYTGLDPQQITLEIIAGQAVTRDVDLTSAARYGQGAGVVTLDSFTISTSRETDNEAIAINEQRFSPNMKNVVAADSLGDVMDGNIGEFLKFIPGVIPEYDYEDGTTVSSVSIRGFAPHMVNVTTDGAPMANTSNAMGDSRSFSFNQASINNISRIEVTKVPTPSSAADSLSGSVNMISKSAFERKSAQFRYNVNLAANSENFTLRRTPHTTDENVHKIRPGGNFDYTLPLSDKFGIVLTGSATDRYAKLHYSYRTYNSAGTATGASPSRPFLQTYRLLDSPRELIRQSIGLKADWRVTPNSVLSVGVQASHFESKRIATEFTMGAGTNANPTPASGSPFSYGDDYTIGATGRGTLTMGGAASVHTVMDTNAFNVRYRFDNGLWRLQAGVDGSRAVGGYRDTAEGHFRQLAINMQGAFPIRVSFQDINPTRAGTLQVFNNSNQEIDWYNTNNYVFNTANSTPRRTDDRFESGFANLRRQLDFLNFPASLEIGGAKRTHTRDIRRRNINWTYQGIDGNRTPTPFLSPVYKNQYHYYGFYGLPQISPKMAWEAFQADPSLFAKTAAQIRNEELFRINNSEYFDESVTSFYAQMEFSLFNYRLKVLTGVRYEETTTAGQGPLVDLSAVWVRNPDGSFARNAAGQRIRKPEAGAASSIEELSLTHHERAYRANRTYDGYYPSLHLNYDLTERFIARAAYAKTYGRPNFNDIIPNAQVDEADLDDEEAGDPSVVQGNITVRNTGLRPWSADNFDVSLEYYTESGGIISGSVFLKEIKDFFGNAVRIATAADVEELGLDPRYVGWRVTTKFNSGDARVTGFEFNIRQSLREVSVWSRHLSVFINGTKLKLEGDREADFNAFTPESLNWGFSYSRRPITFMAKWNYRGKRKLNAQPQIAPDAHEYHDRRLTLDLNLEYQLHRSVFLYAAAQNVLNVPAVTMRYGSETPHYAKRYLTGYNGVGITMGVKGTF